MDRRILRNEKLAEERHQRFLERMDAAEKKAAAADARWERKMAAADARWEKRNAEITARQDKFDRQLLATKKLLEGGIKFVAKLAQETRELKRAQQNFLDTLRIPRNGHSKTKVD